jgi:hypothetical protein
MRRREYEKQTEISFRLPILAYIGDHLEIIIMVHSHQSLFAIQLLTTRK